MSDEPTPRDREYARMREDFARAGAASEAALTLWETAMQEYLSQIRKAMIRQNMSDATFTCVLFLGQLARANAIVGGLQAKMIVAAGDPNQLHGG